MRRGRQQTLPHQFFLVIGTQGFQQPTKSIQVVSSDLTFYSGITPNGDGNNDVWEIDNIEFYPENTVQIFNRWGNEIWFGSGYDNNEVVWIGLDKSGVQLTDGTYFYVVTISGNTTKGWIELTR